MRHLLTLFLIPYFASFSAAQHNISIKPDDKVKDITSNIEIYEEDEGISHTFEQVSHFDNAQFRAVTKPICGFNYKSVWLKFKVNNVSGQDILVDFTPSLADTISLYSVQPNGEIKKSETGARLNFSQRATPNINHNLKLESIPNTEQVYYAHIYTRFPCSIKVRIAPLLTMLYSYNSKSTYAGLTMGILVAFMMISFVMNIALKKLSYFWYGMYLFNTILLLGAYYGFNQKILTPNFPALNIYYALFLPLSLLSTYLFSVYLLKIKKTAPEYHKLVVSNIVFLITAFSVSCLGFIEIGIILSIIFMVPAMGTVLFLAIKVYYRWRHSGAVLLIMSALTIDVGVAVFIYDTGYFNPHINVIESVHYSVLLESVFMALAMAQQVRYILNQKNKAKQDHIQSLKETGEFIIQQNLELEKKINERTQELKYLLDREKEREQKLVRSNSELTEFAHIVSHDLKAPLRNIASFTQLFLRRSNAKFDDRDKEYIDYIITGAKQGTQLVDDLLNYSKLDKNIGDPIPTDLNEVVRLIIFNNGNHFKDKNVEVLIHELPIVNGHLSLVTMLWQNIILNGIKYNENPFPVIEIGCYQQKKEIIYWVRDNGIGIASQYQEEVFRMFRRLHTSDKYEGSGIGLAFCKRIVDNYDGRIWFESEPNVGTTFFFTLPKTVFKNIRADKKDNKMIANTVIAA